jgi:hypothetical protein
MQEACHACDDETRGARGRRRTMRDVLKMGGGKMDGHAGIIGFSFP